MSWPPTTGLDGLLDAISNEELLAVAFTLGGVAAVDVLVKAATSHREFKVAAGCLTLLLTLIGVATYVLLKTHATQLPPTLATSTVQWLYMLTVAGSFFVSCCRRHDHGLAIEPPPYDHQVCRDIYRSVQCGRSGFCDNPSLGPAGSAKGR